MKKFYVDDCPEHKTVHMWIAESLDMQQYVDTMKPVNDEQLLYRFEDTTMDLDATIQASHDAFARFGWHDFKNVYGSVSDSMMKNDGYGGLSTVYNKEYRYYNDVDPNAQTLGYGRSNIPDNFMYKHWDIMDKLIMERLDKDYWAELQQYGTHHGFKYMLDNNVINEEQYKEFCDEFEDRNDVGKRINKNTYSCTWGFNTWSEPAKFGELNKIVERVKRTPIRGRLVSMRNLYNEERVAIANKYLWHTDDSWFYELRLILNLTNEKDEYGIAIKDNGEQKYIPGEWHCFNTGIAHCPTINQSMPGAERINYICAVNPWFDWIEEERCWVQNEFYGKKHPVDMVIDGDVITGIKLKG